MIMEIFDLSDIGYTSLTEAKNAIDLQKIKEKRKMLKIHKLKTVNPFFNRVANRKSTHMKTAELRLNDRNYQVGDTVILQEYNPNDKYYAYSGREITFVITDIVTSEEFPGLQPGYCMLSFTEFSRNFIPEYLGDNSYP